jgi:hypothetical protein
MRIEKGSIGVTIYRHLQSPAATLELVAVVVATVFLALAMTDWARGDTQDGVQDEIGKDPGALWDGKGNRREEPPAPAVPARALLSPAAAAQMAAQRAGELGLAPGVFGRLTSAIESGDPEALGQLIGWTEEACNSGSRGGDVPPCPAGVPEGSSIRTVSAADPFDKYARTEADTRAALEAALSKNRSVLALVGAREGDLFLAFELAETRTLPAELHFPVEARFLIVELRTGREGPVIALSLTEANPLTAYYRFIDPDLSELAFVGPGPIAMEAESDARIRSASPGPVPTVSR